MSDISLTPSEPAPLRAVFWMLITGLNFVAVTIVIKFLGARLPPAEVAFLRYALGLVFLLPFAQSLIAAQWTRRAHLVLGARGLCHALGVVLWFFAMTQIPLAEVTAIGYLSPIFISIGAVLVLGEKIALRRMAAIGISFVGALVILRPGLREITDGHLAMLSAALVFGTSHLLAKLAMRDATPVMVVSMLSLWVPLILLPFALAHWVQPTLQELGLLFLVGCFATVGNYTMMLAFEAAPVTVAQPVTFLQLVWAMLVGTLFFGENVDLWVVNGGLMILASITYISWREAMLKRRGQT